MLWRWVGSTLARKIPWMEEPGGLQSMGSLRVRHDWATSLSLFYFHALEKEMATHSSVLAWRIPGMGKPCELPSMGSHRVGHDWSDLAAAAAAGCFQDIRWKETWPVILNCNLDTTLLWAQTNDFISCACFFFFFQSPNFSSCSFVSRGTCHLKPSPLCIVNQEQIQEREWDRETSTWFLHELCARFDDPIVMNDVSYTALCLIHLYIFSWLLENWSLCGTFHEWSSALHSTKITETYL